jgi:hypothetical protein
MTTEALGAAETLQTLQKMRGLVSKSSGSDRERHAAPGSVAGRWFPGQGAHKGGSRNFPTV